SVTAGLYINPSSGAPVTTLTNSLVRSSGTYGAYFVAISGATATLSIVNSTFHANGTYGLYVSGGSGSSATAHIKNSTLTQQGNGVYRNVGTGTSTVTIPYSDVWNNTTNYTNVAAGAGCISQNPLYVNPPSDLHLQSFSVCIDSGTAVGAPSTDL